MKREIYANFSVTPQTASYGNNANKKCLVKMEKTLNLQVKNMRKTVF